MKRLVVVLFAANMICGGRARGESAMATPTPSATPSATPSIKLKRQKIKKVAKRKSAKKNIGKSDLPNKLPPYLGKQKKMISFDENDSEHVTTVIVRSPHELDDLEKKPTPANPSDKTASSFTNELPTIRLKPASGESRARQKKEVVIDGRKLTPVPLAELQSAAPSDLAQKPEKYGSASPSNLATLPPIQQLPLPSIQQLTLPPNQPTKPDVAVPVNTDKSTDSPPFPPPPEIAQTQAKREVDSHDGINQTQFVTRSSYVNAHYSSVSPELQNGATLLALGLARGFGEFQWRGTVEVGHGLDQSVTPQNIRDFNVRGDVLAPLWGRLWDPRWGRQSTPLLGLGFGYSDIHLRSYRSTDGMNWTERENKAASCAFLAPSAGWRFWVKGVSLDLTAEYIALIGADSNALAGLTAALTASWPIF